MRLLPYEAMRKEKYTRQPPRMNSIRSFTGNGTHSRHRYFAEARASPKTLLNLVRRLVLITPEDAAFRLQNIRREL